MKKFIALFSIILFAFTISACKPKVDENPQAVLDQAWIKLADKNAEYESGEIKFEGKGNLEVGADKGSIEGSGGLLFDTSDPDDSKSAITADLKANGTLEGQSGEISIKGELRTLGENLYINIENFVLKTADPQIDLMGNLIGNLYKSQWIAIPQGINDSFETEQFKGKEVSEIAKKHNFFNIKKVLGYRNYELEINAEELKEYFKEVALLNGGSISDEELLSIDQLLTLVTYTLEVSIGDDYELEEVEGKANIKDPTKNQTIDLSFNVTLEENSTDGSIELELTGESPAHVLLDFKTTHEAKSVSIEVPEEAQIFDPDSLFGFGGGGDSEANPFGAGDNPFEGLPQ